ncbi:hypothetical protein [Nocardioides sp. J54]|uniref:hypothetical protein n=1 Tax=Nocardioides sp. J54 TaxID=935866 RepID=UPI00048F21D5|nr:hypothetical protein [Nocardioides sp. J54]
MTDGPHAFPPPGAPPPEQPASQPAQTAFPGHPGHPGYPGYPGTAAFPAPGAPPPADAPPPGWATYPAPGPGPRPGLALGAAHKPGAFPLRPLGLGDLYDGAFRIIRFNPRATVGAAVLVTAVAMLLPVVITTVLTLTAGLAVDLTAEEADLTTGEAVGLVAAYGSLVVSYFLSFVGIALVTGMVVHVTRAAAVGRRLGLAEAWAATHGKRWRLIGLVTLSIVAFLLLTTAYVLMWVVVVVAGLPAGLVVLWGLLSVPAFIALCCWLWIKAYYLAVPVLMLEPVGVFGSIGRAWRLTTRHFWRTFGLALLTALIGAIGGSILSTPFSLIGQFGVFVVPEYALLLLVVTQALAMVVQNAFSAPFLASVNSMQYLDLRIRKEALDVELLREAGIISA